MPNNPANLHHCHLVTPMTNTLNKTLCGLNIIHSMSPTQGPPSTWRTYRTSDVTCSDCIQILKDKDMWKESEPGPKSEDNPYLKEDYVAKSEADHSRRFNVDYMMAPAVPPALSTFEQKLLASAQQQILKMFSDGSLVMPDYANRIKIPADLVQKIYSLIDYDQVLELLRPKINELVAKKILHVLTEELSADVKKTMSTGPIRDKLKATLTVELAKVVHVADELAKLKARQP